MPVYPTEFSWSTVPFCQDTFQIFFILFQSLNSSSLGRWHQLLSHKEKVPSENFNFPKIKLTNLLAFSHSFLDSSHCNDKISNFPLLHWILCGLCLTVLLQVGSWNIKDGVICNWGKNLSRIQKVGIWYISLTHIHQWKCRKRD